jgi:hypothetical protein
MGPAPWIFSVCVPGPTGIAADQRSSKILMNEVMGGIAG